MPLPGTSNLSLFGPSQPGDGIHSKPKKAILVRLSSEMLDALDVQSQVQFDFGENPGLYIGDACFPMSYSKETANHELYLRAPSAAKKNPPLKLYANVVGKSTVEQREIRNELCEKIRESTQDAVAQKNSRATVFIPTPPETQPAIKKRKEAPMFHKPLRPSDKIKAAAPTAASTSKATPPVQSSSSQQGGVPLRTRLVHCLARADRPERELYKLLGGTVNNALRAEIAGLLDQLAEVKVDRSGKVYKLNPIGWKDVRPFEWHGLSEQERIQQARTGRLNLSNLRIPESDPLWSHFQYRSSVLGSRPTDPKSSALPPKRGISSRDFKEKKTKKGDPKAEIQMKDESKGALKRPTTGAASEGRRTVVDATSSTRPQPSTGQAKPTIRREIKELPSSSNAKPVLPKKKIAEEVPNKTTRKPVEGDSRGSLKRKQMEEPEVNPRTLKRRAVEEDSAQTSSKLKARDDTGPTSRASSKVKARDDDEYIGSTSWASSKLKARDDDEYAGSTSRASLKRKADDDDNELVRKKRLRPDSSTIPSSSRDDSKRRKESVATKTTTVSRTDDRSAASVATPKAGGKRAEPRHSATRSTSSKPTKLRRKSPIYTSTEDEDEDALPSVKTKTKTETTTPAPITTTTTKGQTARSSTVSHALPSNDDDDNTLRARYNAKYLEFLSVIRKLLEQKGRLEALLVKCDLDDSESVSVSDSEGDDGEVELALLNSEELEVLSAKYMRLHAELQEIQDAFKRRHPKRS